MCALLSRNPARLYGAYAQERDRPAATRICRLRPRSRQRPCGHGYPPPATPTRAGGRRAPSRRSSARHARRRPGEGQPHRHTPAPSRRAVKRLVPEGTGLWREGNYASPFSLVELGEEGEMSLPRLRRLSAKSSGCRPAHFQRLAERYTHQYALEVEDVAVLALEYSRRCRCGQPNSSLLWFLSFIMVPPMQFSLTFDYSCSISVGRGKNPRAVMNRNAQIYIAYFVRYDG